MSCKEGLLPASVKERPSDSIAISSGMRFDSHFTASNPRRSLDSYRSTVAVFANTDISDRTQTRLHVHMCIHTCICALSSTCAHRYLYLHARPHARVLSHSLCLRTSHMPSASYPTACNMSPLGRRRGPALRAEYGGRPEGRRPCPQCRIPKGIVLQIWPS